LVCHVFLGPGWTRRNISAYDAAILRKMYTRLRVDALEGVFLRETDKAFIMRKWANYEKISSRKLKNGDSH